MKRLGVLFCALGCASTVMATRPLTVDDADPTGTGQCQLSTGIGWKKNGVCRDWDIPVGLAYGLFPDFEISAAFGEQRATFFDDLDNVNHEAGCDDLLVGAKWQFLGESAWLPRMTLEPGIKIPTASYHKGLGSGHPDYDLTYVASKKLGEKFQVDLNLGNTWISQSGDDPAADALRGGVAVEYVLTETWQWVGEVFAERALRGDGEITIMDSTGLRWLVADGFTLDAAVGSRLRGEDAPHLTATIGLTWVFGVTTKKE